MSVSPYLFGGYFCQLHCVDRKNGDPIAVISAIMLHPMNDPFPRFSLGRLSDHLCQTAERYQTWHSSPLWARCFVPTVSFVILVPVPHVTERCPNSTIPFPPGVSEDVHFPPALCSCREFLLRKFVGSSTNPFSACKAPRSDTLCSFR